MLELSSDLRLKSALTQRPRRLRQSPAMRRLVRETLLTPADFIYPLFVQHGRGVRQEIPSMPGQYRLSVDQLAAEAAQASELGLGGVILFGIPAGKDPVGEENFADDGIVQRAIRELKANRPDLLVITDVCLCEYTDHGHCGLLDEQGQVLNDPGGSGSLAEVPPRHVVAVINAANASGAPDTLICWAISARSSGRGPVSCLRSRYNFSASDSASDMA